MSNTVRNIEISKAEEVGAAIIDEQPQDYSIVQEWADKLGIELPQESAHVTPIKELSALVKGLVKKVLNMFLPQIVNKTEEIYSHLDSRCTDYTPADYASYIPRPYDPMGSTPRTLPNLLQAITAFSARKISNGSAQNDGIKDGESLARLLYDVTCVANVTKIIDDSKGWTLSKKIILLSLFPNLNTLQLNCERCTSDIGTVPQNTTLPLLKTVRLIDKSTDPYLAWIYINNDLILPELVSFYANARGHICQESSINGDFIAYNLERLETGYNPDFYRTTTLKTFYAPKLRVLTGGNWGQSRMLGSDSSNASDKLTRVVVGYGTCFSHANYLTNRPNLIDVEIRQGASASFTLAGWNPTNVLADADKTATFLQNFREHICQRLANRTGQSKLTLTLSADVYTAIMTDNDIKAELVARNWKVTDGTNNYNN